MIWIWILAAIIVFVLYNAERMPEIINKFKKEMPHIVENSKKVTKDFTKELKEKAQAVASEKKEEKKKEKQK